MGWGLQHCFNYHIWEDGSQAGRQRGGNDGVLCWVIRGCGGKRHRKAGCRKSRRELSIDISLSSEFLRAGRSQMRTPSTSTCLDVESWGLSSAVANVEGLKYNSMLDCLASYTFLLYNSLWGLKTFCKAALNLGALSKLKPHFPAVISALPIPVEISHKCFTFSQGQHHFPAIWYWFLFLPLVISAVLHLSVLCHEMPKRLQHHLQDKAEMFRDTV